MSYLANLLNRITMYRLAYLVLLSYIFIALVESLTGLITFDATAIFLQTIYLIAICELLNRIFSRIFGANTNVESATISALILSLIVGPGSFEKNILFLTLLALVAMASKYFLALRKRHIFNPAATAVLILALLGFQGASWWIGIDKMLPIVVIGGILILTKIKRFTMVLSFIGIYLVLAFVFGQNPVNLLLYSPLVFFATIMLTEPLTSPTVTRDQILYSGFVALSYFTYQETLRVPYTLELSLLTGNLFTYFVQKPFRVTLYLKKKMEVAKNTFAFYFKPEMDFDYKAGQFMHWTLPHKNPDVKGIRRYFTVASSPTQDNIMIAVRIPDEPSSFKEALLNLEKGDEITAMDVSGDFTLPDDTDVPLAFIAGGIGVTPFLSMTKWMIDKNEKRDIVLLYSNSVEKDIAFKKLLDKAESVGVKTHYVVTKRDGYIDEEVIKEKVPNWKERVYYISGPQPMVEIFEKMLSKMNVRKIKTDFFPGYTEKHQE